MPADSYRPARMAKSNIQGVGVADGKTLKYIEKPQENHKNRH